jgi:hypothetical protein
VDLNVCTPALKVEALCSSESMVYIYSLLCCYSPEDQHQQKCVKHNLLKSAITLNNINQFRFLVETYVGFLNII